MNTGCPVVVTYPGDPSSIAPGERARIRVSYRLWRTGSSHNEIKVYSNAAGTPHILVISGTGISNASRAGIISTTRYRQH